MPDRHFRNMNGKRTLGPSVCAARHLALAPFLYQLRNHIDLVRARIQTVTPGSPASA